MGSHGLAFILILSIAIIALAFAFSIAKEASSGVIEENLAGEASTSQQGILCQYNLMIAREHITRLEYENRILRNRLAFR